MKKFDRTCAQGDVMFEKVRSIPKSATVVPPTNGQVIVTHSETGHHHVMPAQNVSMFRLDAMVAYLDVKKPSELKHLREHDTHESIQFKPGKYRVRRQREHVVGTDPVERRTRVVED